MKVSPASVMSSTSCVFPNDVITASVLQHSPALPSGRGMFSANAIGDANAHHQVRHRTFHGLRERSPAVAGPQRCAPVVVPQTGTLVAERKRATSPPVSRAERRADAACSFRCPLPPGTAAPSKAAAHVTKTHVVFRFALQRRKRRVSREAASVVSRLARLPLVLQQAPHRLSSSKCGPEGRPIVWPSATSSCPACPP